MLPASPAELGAVQCRFTLVERSRQWSPSVARSAHRSAMRNCSQQTPVAMCRSPTLLAPAVSSARKEFRKRVTAQYGEISQLRCAGKFSGAIVKNIVQQWKDQARSTNNAIVDTDWQPTATRDEAAEALARPPVLSCDKQERSVVRA